MATTASRPLQPTPVDRYPTGTSDLQAATENVLKARLQLHKASPEECTADGPILQRNNHLQFLLRNLVQGFPARYVSQDASQPWLFFWTLQGFSVLGVGLDELTKQRCVSRPGLSGKTVADGSYLKIYRHSNGSPASVRRFCRRTWPVSASAPDLRLGLCFDHSRA